GKDVGMRAHLTERVRIEVDDTSLDEASLPGQQGRLALAYLLVEHHRPVPRDELADLLWGGEPPGSWEKGLAVVISKLRAVLTTAGLGDGVLTHAFGCYQLNLPPDVWIDIEAATRSVEQAEASLAQADAARARDCASDAAAIARRMFLPGAEGLWVEAQRAVLVVVLRRALQCMSEAALALRDPVVATAAASEAVALEPYREQAYLQLIRAQAAGGNRAEALHTYERCRKLLADELGVTPSPQTEAAYLALLDTGAERAPRADATTRADLLADPVIRYARDGDIYVAYHVFGVDAPDLLTFSSGMLPIDSMNEEPSLARFYRRIASFRRVIRFDLRGMGLSDSVAPSSPPTLEQWMHDALAVMDNAGSLRAAVFAPRESSLPGILLAATHPDRVSSLILVNGTARIPEAEDYPEGISQRLLDRFLDLNFEPDATERQYDSLRFFAPTLAHDDAFRAWWNRAGNRGAGPATAKLLDRVRFQADVRALLPLVRVPTLVLHRIDDAAMPVGHGRYLAAHIPKAKYVELPGADDLYWVGDTTAMLDEIEEFLTGVRHSRDNDRVLATVLFSEIAGANERLSRELVDRYKEAATRQLERFRGHEIKTAADVILATFDGPARAVFCAQAIRDAAAEIGLSVKTGLHIGEVDARGEDTGGLTIQIAGEVARLAEPRQVLVSRTVVDVVVGAGIETTDRGEHELRGAPGEWRLFAVED
ncbi:MAG TPA: alpha/beta fold hydrolase, partial [Acidimicrobiia bacterium]|nr:alpha/beta fold hydrolase [Acidimicrobiia bacterium]